MQYQLPYPRPPPFYPKYPGPSQSTIYVSQTTQVHNMLIKYKHKYGSILFPRDYKTDNSDKGTGMKYMEHRAIK